MDINHVSRFLLGVHEDTQTRANTSFDAAYNAGIWKARLTVSGLGPVWHGSGAELQQLQPIFQPNTRAPKLYGAANSTEL